MRSSSNPVLLAAVSFALLLLLQPSLAAQSPVPAPPTLDQRIEAGFAALKARNWKQAQVEFDAAVKLVDAKPAASAYLAAKLPLAASTDVVVTQNGKPRDVAGQVNDYRQAMATTQALYEFLAFSAQLAGDAATAEEYLNKVYELRGPMWGKSWAALIPQLHSLFYSSLAVEGTENFGRYLVMTGGLLLEIENDAGVDLLRRARTLLPKDPTVPAQLASYLIVHNDPAGAKVQARASLALAPNQASVLIDLATAEWLLGELGPAARDANQAAGLRPDMPGPHATLAFIALENGDVPTALREAEVGNKLGNGHQFFKTVWAVSLVASGDHQRAQKLMTEAWEGGPPDEAQLKEWFFRGKALEYARRFMTKRA